MSSLLAKLCRANHGILNQKIDLIRMLEVKHGVEKLFHLYQMPCPMLQASMGQHLRHSMDHIERAALAASVRTASGNDKIDYSESSIHYDQRERGTNDEQDFLLAIARIDRVRAMLEQISNSPLDPNQPVLACFMLSGDSQSESRLPSTIGRELGFAAHHAIHHLAMVKIIATNPKIGGLESRDLPPEFGRAPSTINHDQVQKNS
jgi:hypothetical protein